jgi:hypothetical protein
MLSIFFESSKPSPPLFNVILLNSLKFRESYIEINFFVNIFKITYLPHPLPLRKWNFLAKGLTKTRFLIKSLSINVVIFFFCQSRETCPRESGDRESSLINTFWIPSGVYPVLDTGRV